MRHVSFKKATFFQNFAIRAAFLRKGDSFSRQARTEGRSDKALLLSNDIIVDGDKAVGILIQTRLDQVSVDRRRKGVGKFDHSLFLVIHKPVYYKLVDAFDATVADLVSVKLLFQKHAML